MTLLSFNVTLQKAFLEVWKNNNVRKTDNSLHNLNTTNCFAASKQKHLGNVFIVNLCDMKYIDCTKPLTLN